MFNIPPQIGDMVRYTEYLTKVNKSELYRKAISWFIKNQMEVTDEILYMPLSLKPAKEQVYIESCKDALNRYRVMLQEKCEENQFLISGPGIMQKRNRYRNSTIILQAIINYLFYLYDGEEQAEENETIRNGLKYMKENRLIWNEK